MKTTNQVILFFVILIVIIIGGSFFRFIFIVDDNDDTSLYFSLANKILPFKTDFCNMSLIITDKIELPTSEELIEDCLPNIGSLVLTIYDIGDKYIHIRAIHHPDGTIHFIKEDLYKHYENH